VFLRKRDAPSSHRHPPAFRFLLLFFLRPPFIPSDDRPVAPYRAIYELSCALRIVICPETQEKKNGRAASPIFFD